MSVTANVEVDGEIEKYALSGDAKGAMYYYDIYLGNSDMLLAPFGAGIMIDENEEAIS